MDDNIIQLHKPKQQLELDLKTLATEVVEMLRQQQANFTVNTSGVDSVELAKHVMEQLQPVISATVEQAVAHAFNMHFEKLLSAVQARSDFSLYNSYVLLT